MMSYILLWLRGPVGWGGCPIGSHPLTPGKMTSSSSTGVYISCQSPPVAHGWVPGSTFNSLCATSCCRSSINCLNWASSRSPRSMWNWHRALLSGWGLLGGDQETSSPFGVGDWVPSLPAMHALRWVVEGGEVQSLIGSSHQAMALVTLCTLASISLLDWNKMIDSITNSQSTPFGCVCPTLTQSLTMSSSCMEVASNGVPSPLARTRTHIWLRSLDSLPRVWLWAGKVDMVDISGWGD